MYDNDVSGNAGVHHTSRTCSSGGWMHISDAGTSRYHNVDTAGCWRIQLD